MTLRDYIITKYNECKELYGETIDWEDNEDQYQQFKQENYIEVSRSLSNLLFHIVDRKNPQLLESLFELTVLLLIQACLIENKKPKVKLNETGFGYGTFTYRPEEQMIMQFMETYLKCQVVQWDLVWFIELGEKLNIIKFNK